MRGASLDTLDATLLGERRPVFSGKRDHPKGRLPVARLLCFPSKDGPSTGIIIGSEIGPSSSTACAASPSEGACMDWPNKAWRFLKSEENRKTLAFVGGGIAAVVIGGWQFYTHFALRLFRATRSGRHDAGRLASGREIPITETGPGTLIVGGVHVFHRRDFQRSRPSSGLPRPRGELLQDPGRSRRSPPRTSTAPSATSPSAKSKPQEDLKRYTSDDPEAAALENRHASLGGRRFRSGRAVIERSEREGPGRRRAPRVRGETTPALGRPIEGQQRRLNATNSPTGRRPGITVRPSHWSPPRRSCNAPST